MDDSHSAEGLIANSVAFFFGGDKNGWTTVRFRHTLIQ